MPETRNGVLAAGNFIVDAVKIINTWPDQDTLASIVSESSSNGGGPYNLLKNLARMDPALPLAAIANLGNDAAGQWIRDDCQAAGIDTSGIQTADGISTSYTDAMSVQSTGRRTFFRTERGSRVPLPS